MFSLFQTLFNKRIEVAKYSVIEYHSCVIYLFIFLRKTRPKNNKINKEGFINIGSVLLADP